MWSHKFKLNHLTIHTDENIGGQQDYKKPIVNRFSKLRWNGGTWATEETRSSSIIESLYDVYRLLHCGMPCVVDSAHLPINSSLPPTVTATIIDCLDCVRWSVAVSAQKQQQAAKKYLPI